MSHLDNIRHERFARLIAKGIGKTKAYHLAGYKYNKGNAIALWRHKGKTSQKIQNRVRELMKKDSANLSAQDILDHVYSTFELAYNSGQATAALKAMEMLGKERGLWKDRREQVNINLGSLTWEQTEQVLIERYGDKASIFMDMLRKYYNNPESPGFVGSDNAHKSHLQLDYADDNE